MSRVGSVITLLLALLVFGCAQEANTDTTTESTETNSETAMEETPAVSNAIVVLTPATGSSVSGTLMLQSTNEGVRVTGQVTGLDPGSEHGLHIHEFGDLTSSDGTSLGSHFNPTGADHGLPSDNDEARHIGDFGNITADENGVAAIDQTFPGVSVQQVLGRGVVVHEDPDDGSQPTGNAGGRLAFGVIGVENTA